MWAGKFSVRLVLEQRCEEDVRDVLLRELELQEMHLDPGVTGEGEDEHGMIAT